MKKIALSLLAYVMVFQFALVNDGFAAPAEDRAPAKIMAAQDKKMPMPPPFRRPTKEQIVEKLSKDYGYAKDFLTSLADKYNYMDLGTGCLYAKLSGCEVEKVLQLRKESNTWGKIRKLLFKDADTYAAKLQEYNIEKFEPKENLTKEAYAKLLKQGHSTGDIMKASQIAAKASLPVNKVISMHTAAFDWTSVEKKLGVYEEPKEENPWRRMGSSVRRGRGFAGLHMGKKNQQELVDILHEDYLFEKGEIAKYMGRLGFNETENICLVAYMAEVPLSKVDKLRSKYSWDIIKKKLGLTPNVYEARCIAYQARRLHERMDIPVDLTLALMHDGYGMHYTNTAFLLNKASGKSIEEILQTKASGKSWKEVCEVLGIPEDELKVAQKKISAAFGRH